MKISIEQIKQDLKDIQYYHSHQAIFQKAVMTEAIKIMICKAVTYQEIMMSAPFDLFIIYEGLYVHKQTQKALAEYLEISQRTVRRRREQIYQYLQKRLKFYKDFNVKN